MANKKVNKESFEFSYNRLEEILNKMENEADDINLDEMLKMYKEGLELLKLCRTKLCETELEIQNINSEVNIK